jgi:sporulation protein YlmC with PRC-barrel domain
MGNHSDDPHASALERLSDTSLVVADERYDIRGRKVVDRAGSAIGHVNDLFIDRADRKVRMLELRAGGFLGLGDRHFLLPVDAVTSVTKDEVHVNESLERVVGSPPYDPKLVAASPRTWGSHFEYYGLSPYWESGYMYPGIPIACEDSDVAGHGAKARA